MDIAKNDLLHRFCIQDPVEDCAILKKKGSNIATMTIPSFHMTTIFGCNNEFTIFGVKIDHLSYAPNI